VSGAVRKTTFKIPKLIPFNKYQFRVSAQNMFGVGDPATTGNVLSRHPFDTPGPPVHVQVREITRESLKLLWSPPENDGGSEIVGFLVERKEKTSVRWERLNKLAFFMFSGVHYQPDPPKKVDITEITPITVSLAWVKPDYDGGSRITSYVVEKLRTSVEDAQWERCTVLSLTRCTVTDLVPHEEYRFRVSAQNYGAISEPRETTAVVCKEQIVPASIDLSAVTSDVLILKEGQDFILKLPYHGMPTPAVTWYKGLGVFRETIRVVTKTVGGVTQLIFRKCEKVDGGTYTVVVANPAGKQTAEIQFRVPGKPGPPVGPITSEDMTPETATLNWQVPTDDGGMYVVEKSDNRGASWVYVSSNVKRCCLRVTKLVYKKEYLFESALRTDEPTPPYDLKVSEVTKDAMLVSWHAPESDGGAEITGYTCERRERNSNLCPLRRARQTSTGKPFPEVTWNRGARMVSKMARHKFEKTNRAAVLTILECTRSDAGEYNVRVKNDSGLAEAKCKLQVFSKPQPPTNFEEPEDDGGSPITSYIVERCDLRYGWIQHPSLLPPGEETSFRGRAL
ncbi:Titin-like, partial [Branchiostoma belcheri]